MSEQDPTAKSASATTTQTQIEVRAPTTMGSDFAAQFARARQLRSESTSANTAGDGGAGGSSSGEPPVPTISLEDYEKAQVRLGDDGKEEEQAMIFGHQGGMAEPGKSTSDSLDTFLQRVERGHGMVDVKTPIKAEILATETTEAEPPL